MSADSLPARSARHIRLLPGQSLKVINVHGTQAIMMWAFSAPPHRHRYHHHRHHRHHNSDDLSPTGDRRPSETTPLTPVLISPFKNFAHLCPGQTRGVIFRSRVQRGDSLHDNHRLPLLILTADTSESVHDLVGTPCNSAHYRQIGLPSKNGERHETCANNLVVGTRQALTDLEAQLMSELSQTGYETEGIGGGGVGSSPRRNGSIPTVLSPLSSTPPAIPGAEAGPRFSISSSSPAHGLARLALALRSITYLLPQEGEDAGEGWMPDSVNLFFNMKINETGGASLGPPCCPKGGYVVFRAERDCVVVLSACPMDVMADEGWYETVGAEFEILGVDREE